MPRAHRLARLAGIRVIQLKDEPFVFFPKSAGPTAWNRTMDLCKEQGFQARVVQEAPHWVTVTSLVVLDWVSPLRPPVFSSWLEKPLYAVLC